VIEKLSDENEWQVRLQGIEELEGIIAQTDFSCIGGNISGFVKLLNKLVGDKNFKISLTSLKIIYNNLPYLVPYIS